jgi:DNA (cytosine-5)-methyltransferase 1
MTEMKPTVVGLFAGVGGIELGFKKAGFDVQLANEIDPYAATTYRLNNRHVLVEGDIASLKSDQLPAGFTVLSGGFPCQPFSVAGYRQGFDDERGNVFWEIDRLIRETNPEVVFLENVKNLRTHDGGNTFKVIREALESNGYTVFDEVLNAKHFGNIPQNRERIFIVAFRSSVAAANFSWPKPVKLTNPLEKFIDFESKLDAKYYYGPERPFFDLLKQEITHRGTIYQWRRQYVRANKSGDCPTLTANMGMGGHNVPLVLTKHGIRKLTPKECFALMGFDRIRFPIGMAESRLYKQAGNAVVVPVVTAIAKRIRIALEAV